MGKQWKQHGPEDQFVLQLLREKKINKSTSPKELKNDILLFLESSPKTWYEIILITLKRVEGICEYSLFKKKKIF